MDDMKPFERQVGEEISRIVGPAHPVDDLAIFEVAASHQRRWRFSMFSALKLAGAAVIVALFGGFLLAGGLTAPQDDGMAPAAVSDAPSPTTSDDILPGVSLTVEEVDPGVYRVAADGVRELESADIQGVSAGYDGNIWLLREEAFRRLGSEEAHAWARERRAETEKS